MTCRAAQSRPITVLVSEAEFADPIGFANLTGGFAIKWFRIT